MPRTSWPSLGETVPPQQSSDGEENLIMAEATYPLSFLNRPDAERARRFGGVVGKSGGRGWTAGAPKRLPIGQRLALQDNPSVSNRNRSASDYWPVENFIRAVGKIQGLEWLGEYGRHFSPRPRIRGRKESSKHLRGQLFLIMTDQRAYNASLGNGGKTTIRSLLRV